MNVNFRTKANATYDVHILTENVVVCVLCRLPDIPGPDLPDVGGEEVEDPPPVLIEEGLRQKKRQRSSLLIGEQNLFNSLLFCTGQFEI